VESFVCSKMEVRTTTLSDKNNSDKEVRWRSFWIRRPRS